MELKSKYSIGQIVYLVTDIEQRERMVIGILFRATGILYELSYGTSSYYNYEVEISCSKDILKQLTN